MVEKVWDVNVTTTIIYKCWKHIDMISSDTLTSSSSNTSSVIASHNVEFAYFSMLLDRHFQSSIRVGNNEFVVTMSAKNMCILKLSSI